MHQLHQPEPNLAACHSFASWYTSRFCTDDGAAALARLQNYGPPAFQRAATTYLSAWTHCGDGGFYVLLFAVLIVAGYGGTAIFFCVALAATLYATDILKDMTGCPRPYSPPVRKMISESHQHEYGFPSTHTAMSCMLGYLIVRECAITFPTWESYAIIFGLSFAGHISFSRYYLGAHWIADIVGGVVVFAFLAGADLVGFGHLFRFYTVDAVRASAWHIAATFAVGRAIVSAHAAPRDKCQCYEDSARFVGAAAGFVAGGFMNVILLGTSGVLVPIDVVSARTLMVFVVVTVPSVVIQDLTSRLLKRVLPKLLSWLAGNALPDVPTSLRPLYTALCMAFGLVVMLKRPRSRYERRILEEGGTLLSPTAATPPGVGFAEEGLMWSLLTHRHWTETDILSKYVSYFVLGVVATCVAPMTVLHFSSL